MLTHALPVWSRPWCGGEVSIRASCCTAHLGNQRPQRVTFPLVISDQFRLQRAFSLLTFLSQDNLCFYLYYFCFIRFFHKPRLHWLSLQEQKCKQVAKICQKGTKLPQEPADLSLVTLPGYKTQGTHAWFAGGFHTPHLFSFSFLPGHWDGLWDGSDPRSLRRTVTQLCAVVSAGTAHAVPHGLSNGNFLQGPRQGGSTPFCGHQRYSPWWSLPHIYFYYFSS